MGMATKSVHVEGKPHWPNEDSDKENCSQHKGGIMEAVGVDERHTIKEVLGFRAFGAD